MARAGRPASESYQPVCCSITQSASYSSGTRLAEPEDADDRAPIFSLSKSSMDVVMATGPPHKRDPAWTRMDLRRSSSANTHSECNSVTLQQLHPRMWQHANSSNGHQPSLAAQRVDVHSPPALSEHWLANMHRWSECSAGTHSRSSTPDTVVWKGGTSRPSSLTQETPYSPLSKSTTPSPFISPQQMPTFPPGGLLTRTSHQQEDLNASSPVTSAPPSPRQARTSSPSPHSPDLLPLASAEDEGFLENNSPSFTFPSPIPSSVSLAVAGASSDAKRLVDDVMETLPSPGGVQLSEGGGARRPAQMLSYPTPNKVCNLELPWQLGQSGLTERGWRSPLVSSLSDSLLGDCCRCNLNTRGGAFKAQVFREEGTMTSQPEFMDAAVQTISPVGSSWGLRKNASNSNMGSHSYLGSPPGSRLNLKSSVGSNSNLVSPSSSMFRASSGEEEEAKRGEDPTWDVNSASSHDLERRRSCLKMKILQEEERDSMGRRSSMKQVQWDEDGMTWDVHGASLDPEVLSSAIRKHLELQSSPQPWKRSSKKKKKAPKPPLKANEAKAELHLPAMVIPSTCTVEGESEEMPEADGGRREVTEEGGEGKTEEAARRRSRAEGANAKDDEEEGTGHLKSPSSGSGRSGKKSVIRSLRRPGWCGGSSKPED